MNKLQLVRDYFSDHPSATLSDCAKAINITIANVRYYAHKEKMTCKAMSKKASKNQTKNKNDMPVPSSKGKSAYCGKCGSKIVTIDSGAELRGTKYITHHSGTCKKCNTSTRFVDDI